MSIAKLVAGLGAVKAVLAIQMNPSEPKQALERIQHIEESLAKLDPNAAARQQFSDVLEMIRTLEKHGGPKQA
jgi:hypothetical protein